MTQKNSSAAKWLFVAEITIVAGIFYLAWRHQIPFSKTPFLFVLGWISLRLRGQRWKDVGFMIAPNWPTLLLIGLLAGVGIEALEFVGTQPALTRLFGKGPNLSELNRLIGNKKLLVVGVVLSWVMAALGEELLYRGYLMNRIAGILGGFQTAGTARFIFMLALFGLHHFSQGVTGVTENIIDGAILGGLYLANERNQLSPIVVH